MGKKNPEGAAKKKDTGGDHALLSTKLTPPRLHPHFMPRQSLLARLERWREHKLTLISAPAGFGKTMLVSEWIASCSAQDQPPPIAWVALDEGDNDPVRFWRYILSACKAFDEGTSKNALALLNSPSPPFEALLTSLINGLAQLSSEAVIVLEDYHAITARQIHEEVTYFLEHLSPSIHIILMARSDPPLPLARLRARNELNELRAGDLRFSLEELQEFLDQELPFALSTEAVSRLASRTEGWVAGLRLVSLALLRRGEEGGIEQYLETFTGSHRPVMDYLVSDVFSTQPEPLQQFLLQTSVLPRLTGSLCDAITGRGDSALVLEKLERDNLFIVSLDTSQQWYRFHALFAEAMQHLARQRIGEDRLRQLSLEASIWYEKNDMLSEAVEAALSAQAFPRAAGLIDRIIPPQLIKNEFHTLRRWITPLPPDVLRSHPHLCLTHAISILLTSDRYSPETYRLLQPPLRMAERIWQDEGNRKKLGEVFAFRSLAAWYQRDLSQAFGDARHALELLPEDNLQWRGVSLTLAGLEELYAGRLNSAREHLLQAVDFCGAVGNTYARFNASLLLGRVYYGQGEMHKATALYRQVLEEIERTPLDRELAEIRKGRTLVGLSALDLEWNMLESAERSALQAFDIVQAYPDEELYVLSSLFLARIYGSHGELEKAQDRLQSLVAQVRRVFVTREAEVLQARLALRAGELSKAQRWQDALTEMEELPRYLKEQEALLAARMHLARGEAETALGQLDGWLKEALAEGRVRSELEIRLIMAMAHGAVGEMYHTLEFMVGALTLGQSLGFQRIFLDEGQPFARLLRAVLPQIEDESLAAYARALLYTIANEQVGPAAFLELPSEQRAEPLSEQEQRVLRLLAAGLSTPEIAEELVVSVNTAKTHVKNVYGKLGVNNRRQARETARHLNLTK